MASSSGRATTRLHARTPEAILRGRAQKLSALALRTLADIMKGAGQDSVRLAAAREVLDRGHGRPKPGDSEEAAEGMTVIVKRFCDVTEEEEAEAAAYR